MRIVTTYAFELHVEKKMFCRISHYVIWYKIYISKEIAACFFATLMLKLKVKVKVIPWHSYARTEGEVEV